MCDTTVDCDVPLVSIEKPGDVDLEYNWKDPCYFEDPGDAQCVSSFRDTCRSWANDLEFESSSHGNSDYDTMNMIGHIGFWVDRANSCHCAGKAMDISKIEWNGVVCEPCRADHSGSSTRKRRYLAVDASLRRFFKWTLDGWYDSAHSDHIHASSHYAESAIVLSKSSKSDTVFVQAVCNNFDSAGLVIDGIWGPLTDAAFADINSAWDFDVSQCSPFTSHSAYRDWLHRVIAAGFANVSASGVDVNDGCNLLGPAPEDRTVMDRRLLHSPDGTSQAAPDSHGVAHRGYPPGRNPRRHGLRGVASRAHR
jgi:hypothetical protein